MMYPLIVIVISILILVIWAISRKKLEKTNEKTDADKVSEEAEKVKQRIKEIGIPELIGNLYHDYIKNYPNWISNKNSRVCSLITDAVDLGKEYDAESIRTRIKIALKGKDYIFSFKEYGSGTPSGKLHINGDLELFLNDDRILALNMFKDYNKDDARWNPVYVEAFIEGDWLRDFQEMEKEIKSQEGSKKGQDNNPPTDEYGLNEQ